MNVTLTVSKVDPQLLRQQYRTLINISRIVDKTDKAEDVEGLLHFLEGIFDQNPEHFPMSETPKVWVVKHADYADRGYCDYYHVSDDLYQRLINCKMSGPDAIEPDRQGELWLEGPYAELLKLKAFQSGYETDPDEGAYDIIVKSC